jgi:serine phosphatase RsbU (regulator of sigma subunit)/tetratricopeptide (TPR) repeat protein
MSTLQSTYFCFLVVLLSLFCNRASAQRNPGDSIASLINPDLEDTALARLYADLANYHINFGSVQTGDSCAELALKYGDQSGSQTHIARAYLMKGLALDYSGKYDEAIEKFQEGISFLDTLRYPKDHGHLLQGIANAYYFKTSLETAQGYYYRSMKARERAKDSVGIAGSMMGMANVYADNGQVAQSISFYKTALGIQERHGNIKMVSWLLNNIGSMLVKSGQPDSALPYFERSMEIKQQLGDQYGLSTTYNNLGEVYLQSGEPRMALYYFGEAYKIRMDGNMAHEMANSYMNIGHAYMELKIPDSAAIWLDSAIHISQNSGIKEMLFSSLFLKAELLNSIGENEAAYQNLLLAYKIKDSVMTETSSRQINELIQKYGAEEKEQRIALQNAEIEAGKTFKQFLYLILGLVLLLALVLLGGYIRKRKTNALLETKNLEIEKQKTLVEEKNKDIIDSITYARRIQTALLPAESRMKSLLPESFVVYKPRDIVSGDFYLVEEWGKETIVAAIDCTGHGVPGAFMSFMAYDLFQEAVMEHGVTKPSAILTRMRSGVTRMLGRESEAVYDGMDAAICTLNESKTVLTYSGAHRPLWMFRNGEFTEYKETKCSVSPSEYDQGNFESHEIEAQPGDIFYIFSDGYADQFGGPHGKKFKLSRLKQLLHDFHKSPMNVQEEKYAGAFSAWKHHHEQVDDVLLIGFRIP